MMSFFLIGCKKKSEEQSLSRVTVDINPSIELIIDEENKVVSVTALNDDGNIIIVGETFIGKTSEEAVALIVSIATETGYLVKGEVEATENEINISVSGDEKAQEELYNSIKESNPYSGYISSHCFIILSLVTFAIIDAAAIE